MTDIVERLRDPNHLGPKLMLMYEAADEIERLRRQVAGLHLQIALADIDDEDNSQAFAQQLTCLHCEERFTLGEMLPGKLAMDPMRCPHCKLLQR